MDQAASPSNVIGAGVTRMAIPDWVVLEDFTVPAAPAPDYIAQGRCLLLEENQVDLTSAERAWFVRRAELIVAAAGAEASSQFEAVFEPSCQRLEVHRIWVKRGDQIIVHDRTDGFEIMRREKNLEQRIFDGSLTVHFAIPDVRPGDIVETAYTLYGERPVLSARHAAWRRFEYFGISVFDIRHRLLTPAGRIVKTKALNNAPHVSEHNIDGVLDRRWRACNTKPLQYEPLAPQWIVQAAEIQFSEWADWREVREAFAPGYSAETDISDSLLSEIDKIDALNLAPDARFMAALSFVQESVRYLAVAIGNGGLVPRTLNDIWTTRYGDCKDKSKLLCLVTERLGLDVCAALVNTREGHGIDSWLPTGVAFDHCIVRYRSNGATYWFDPTKAPQRSPIDTAQQSHFGWALPLANDVDNLEWMPEPEVETLLSARERISIGYGPAAPVRYEWRLTHRKARAEWIRAIIAREGEANLFKAYAKDIQSHWPKATPLRQEIIDDDLIKNEITVLEVYEIAEAWVDTGAVYGFATLDLVLKKHLAPLEHGELRYPIHLGGIGRTERRVEIESAKPLPCTGWRREGKTDALEFSNAFAAESKNMLVLEVSMAVKERTLPPERAKEYRDLVSELGSGDVVLRLAASGGEFIGEVKEGQKMGFWSYAGIIWLIFVVLSAIARGAGGP